MALDKARRLTKLRFDVEADAKQDLGGRFAILPGAAAKSEICPQDVRDLARDVIRHRLVLSYEALAEGIGPDDLLTPILDAVTMPDVPLRERRQQPQTTTETSWTTGQR